MTTLLLLLGALLIIVGGLMLLVATFRVGIWWGLFCLLFAPLQIVFVVKYWHEAKSSIVTQVTGFVLVFLALLVGGKSFTEQYKAQLNQYMQQIAPEQMQQWNELQSMIAEPTMMSLPAATVKPAANNAVNSDITVVTTDKKQDATTASGDQKIIHKCVDAKGHVAYTEQPCEGAQEKKVITITEGKDTSVDSSSGKVLDAVKTFVAPKAEPAR